MSFPPSLSNMDINNTYDQSQDAYFGTGWELMNHVTQVYQIRELALGILHSTSPSLLIAAPNVCRKIEKRLKADGTQDRHVTESESQTLLDLLGTMQFPKIRHKGAASKDGQAAISMLMNAVYGRDSHDVKAVIDIVAFGPMNKAGLFRQACASLLRRCIDASNCFTLMVLGHSVGCDELMEQTLLYALSDFSTCFHQNRQGFCQLEEDSLLRLLQNSHFQVSSDNEALDAILTWVNFKAEKRGQLLPTFLEAFVRLEELDVSDLAALTIHPLVADNTACLQVVTDAYMRKCMAGDPRLESGLPSQNLSEQYNSYWG